MVKYEYNAWGEHTVTDRSGNSLGTKNPFRYRSYFYDIETGLYFLKTRYYDPEIGRFINMDSIKYADPESINGLNLYAYCNNNPVMNVDPNGDIAFATIVVSMVIGAIIGGTIAGVQASKDGLDANGIFCAALGGAIMGAAVSGAFMLGGAAITGLTIFGKAVSISGTMLFAIATYGSAAAGVINYQLESIAYKKTTSLDGYALSAVEGAFEGAISFIYGMFAGAKGYLKFADKSIFNIYKTYETICRLTVFNLPSALLRKLMKNMLI